MSSPRKDYYKSLLTNAASNHLEFTVKASEAAIEGDEKKALRYQTRANNSLNNMLTLQRSIIGLEAHENNRKLRLVHEVR